jgi:16S rRNA (cytosine967-C5)-methyltransferase
VIQRLLQEIFTLNELNLSSLGINHIRIIQLDGLHPPLKDNSIDKILLDAPCTGSGTFTSNPELKWRQNEKFLRRNVMLQKRLILSAIKALKVGGTLVYSTCSLYPEEGEHQIQEIIDDQLTPASTPSWLPPSYKINGSFIKGAGRFLPANHDTIGFFVAKMIKNK